MEMCDGREFIDDAYRDQTFHSLELLDELILKRMGGSCSTVRRNHLYVDHARVLLILLSHHLDPLEH